MRVMNATKVAVFRHFRSSGIELWAILAHFFAFVDPARVANGANHLARKGTTRRIAPATT